MSFTAVVLTSRSRNELLEVFELPRFFEPIAHHMTLYMGKPREEHIKILGARRWMVVTHVAFDQRVMAVKVRPFFVKSDNKIPHVTLGVYREIGGKPFMSNFLKDWQPVMPFFVSGHVREQ